MRRHRKDIERQWYDCFSRWSKGDRAAALKVLAILHDQLPDSPRAKQPPTPAVESGLQATMRELEAQ